MRSPQRSTRPSDSFCLRRWPAKLEKARPKLCASPARSRARWMRSKSSRSIRRRCARRCARRTISPRIGRVRWRASRSCWSAGPSCRQAAGQSTSPGAATCFSSSWRSTGASSRRTASRRRPDHDGCPGGRGIAGADCPDAGRHGCPSRPCACRLDAGGGMEGTGPDDERPRRANTSAVSFEAIAQPDGHRARRGRALATIGTSGVAAGTNAGDRQCDGGARLFAEMADARRAGAAAERRSPGRAGRFRIGSAGDRAGAPRGHRDARQNGGFGHPGSPACRPRFGPPRALGDQGR